MKPNDQDQLLIAAITALCLAALAYGGLVLLTILAHGGVAIKEFDPAAWTQAVGSVGALLGVWYTIKKQRQLAIEAEQRARRAAEQAAELDASTAVAAISAVVEYMKERPAHIASIGTKMHRSRLQQGLLLAQAVQVTNLSVHKRAAVLALRNVATTVMDCVDVAAVASSDREMLEADRYLSAVLDDQVGKLEVLAKILAAPR